MAAAYSESPDDEDEWYDQDAEVIEGGFFTRSPQTEWRVCVGCGDHFETERALGVICERCDFLNSCDEED